MIQLPPAAVLWDVTQLALHPKKTVPEETTSTPDPVEWTMTRKLDYVLKVQKGFIVK